jgi:hypothetical protein
MRYFLLSFFLIFFTLPAYADWSDNFHKGFERGKNVISNLVDDTITYTRENNIEPLGYSISNLLNDVPVDKDSFNRIWDSLLPKLENANSIHNKMSGAPSSSWIFSDKGSHRQDLNNVLDDIIAILDNNSVSKFRENFRDLEVLLRKKEQDIQGYKESRVSAPVKHTFKTTKSEYDTYIKNTTIEINDIKKEIDVFNKVFARKLREFGIDLTIEQTKILLSRVDSDDIIQMSVVFKILKQVTVQLMELANDNGNKISDIRRYYGMYVILLETVVYMQNKYIEHVNNEYIPKLQGIISDVNNLRSKTMQTLNLGVERKRREIYAQNLNAQNLTIKTAELYSQVLKTQRGKISNARKNSEKDLLLAMNTYSTVQLDSELLKLLKDSKHGFDTLISMQVPVIVPFENFEMQSRFKELTIEISN